MQYTTTYHSPIGDILLAADTTGLTGLWFEGARYFANGLDSEHKEQNLPIFTQTKQWLDTYFSSSIPDEMPPIHMTGSDFRLAVWQLLLQVPYGQTITYGALARKIEQQMGIPRMSAQAIGGAIAHNPICILIPCHRVIGTNGSLTGYAGGIDKKIKLLSLEKADLSGLFVPKKGTAL